MIYRRVFTIALIFSCFFLKAQETEFPKAEPLSQANTYKSFWDKLYANGGWSLYCGFKFNKNGETLDKGRVYIERVYPLDWIIKTLSCKTRLQCHQNGPENFHRIESDLHNIYPVWWEIQSTKRDATYGELTNEISRFKNCDFKRRNNITEPREIAKGNVARAIFYMHKRYQLPVNEELYKTLLEWNKEDLPSEQELTRNDLIEKIQGNRNEFIDNPNLAETLEFTRRIDSPVAHGH